MAIKINFNGASIAKPGAYSQTKVNLSGGFPLSATGIVAIIGEALGGAPGSVDGVQTFTSEDLAALTDKYKSGPIIDAARMLIAPARDNRVANGASLIRVYKTNASTQAQRMLLNAASDDLLLLKSLNYGEDENLISVSVANGSSSNNKVITIKKGGLTEVLPENPYESVISIQYTGSDPVCTVEVKLVAGAKALVLKTGSTPGDDLTIPLANKTVADLVDLVDDSPVYTASSALSKPAQVLASDLDWVITPVSVISTATLRKAQKELADIINANSSLVSAEIQSEVEGLPANLAASLLSGGSRGASSNSSFQAGFDALLAERCNIVVPLVARDASALIPLGETDPASTFTVDAINLQALTHCITAQANQ